MDWMVSPGWNVFGSVPLNASMVFLGLFIGGNILSASYVSYMRSSFSPLLDEHLKYLSAHILLFLHSTHDQLSFIYRLLCEETVESFVQLFDAVS